MAFNMSDSRVDPDRSRAPQAPQAPSVPEPRMEGDWARKTKKSRGPKSGIPRVANAEVGERNPIKVSIENEEGDEDVYELPAFIGKKDDKYYFMDSKTIGGKEFTQNLIKDIMKSKKPSSKVFPKIRRSGEEGFYPYQDSPYNKPFDLEVGDIFGWDQTKMLADLYKAAKDDRNVKIEFNNRDVTEDYFEEAPGYFRVEKLFSTDEPTRTLKQDNRNMIRPAGDAMHKSVGIESVARKFNQSRNAPVNPMSSKISSL